MIADFLQAAEMGFDDDDADDYRLLRSSLQKNLLHDIGISFCFQIVIWQFSIQGSFVLNYEVDHKYRV